MFPEFFRTRHRQNVGLDDAAELLGLTPARASEKIKREFGRNFAVLLTEHRLKTACLLLENSMFTIEQIARQSGFSCGSYFFRLFTRLNLNTTADYLKKIYYNIAGKDLIIGGFHTVKGLTSYGNNSLEFGISCELTAGKSRIAFNYIQLAFVRIAHSNINLL